MPSNIPLLCQIMQAKSQLLRIQILAESGVKEYEAEWLPEAKKVMRDGTGKFAKKGSDTVEVTKDLLKQGTEITSNLIMGLVKDPEFRQRIGLVAGLAGAKALEQILEKSQIDPRFEAKLNNFIAESTQKLADEYGDDKDPFAQAIRTSGIDEHPQGMALKDRIEYDLIKYQAYLEALKNPQKYDNNKNKDLIGKAVKASIPIAIYLGLTLGPEVLLGLLAKESLEAILISSAVGQAVSFGANKAMDKADIENPWIRNGIDLAVGIAASGLLLSNKAFKNKWLSNEKIEHKGMVKNHDKNSINKLNEASPTNIPKKLVSADLSLVVPAYILGNIKENSVIDVSDVKRLIDNSLYFLSTDSKSAKDIQESLELTNKSILDLGEKSEVYVRISIDNGKEIIGKNFLYSIKERLPFDGKFKIEKIAHLKYLSVSGLENFNRV